jgi:hypothetical protein
MLDLQRVRTMPLDRRDDIGDLGIALPGLSSVPGAMTIRGFVAARFGLEPDIFTLQRRELAG